MNNEQVFYIGIAEDRDDPLFLGRCRVRIVGVHTADKAELPTEGLPWATPVQSITSAAVSGIGNSPTGIVESSQVLIIFTDPDSKQQPLILGTIAGIPVKANIYDDDFKGSVPRISNETPTSKTEPYLGEGEVEVPQVVGEIGSLSSNQVDKLMAALRQRESSNNYKAVNSLGYTGAYQFGCAMLEDLGYIKSGTWAKYKRNKVLVDTQGIWSGKNGITSQQLFLNSNSVQDSAARSELNLWYKRMVKGGLASSQTPPAELSGLLAVAHLKGTGSGGVRDFLRNQATTDAYGTSPTEYYRLGFKCVDSGGDIVIPTEDNVTVSKRSKAITSIGSAKTSDGAGIGISPETIAKGNPSKFGFTDPSQKYPLDNHLNEPDTNRLARSQSIKKTIVSEKETNRATKISIANTDYSWDQPYVPYNAQYPFNHVSQSESGHIHEIDDTPGFERLHTYHRAGTFSEIDLTGSEVNRIVGSKVTIVEHDDKIYVMGSGFITIDGDFAVDIKRSLHVEIQGNANINVHGDVNQKVTGDYNLSCKNFNLNCLGNMNYKIADTVFISAENNFNLSSNSEFRIESAETYNIKSGDKINLDSASDVNIKSGGNAKINPAGTCHILSGGTTIINAGGILFSPEPNIGGGATAAGSATSASSGSEIIINQTWTPEITQFDIPTYESALDFINEGFIFSEIDKRINDAEIPSTNVTATDKNVIEYPITNATRLSPNFTVRDLVDNVTKGLPELGQHGLSQEQLVINLQNLAVNVLEPIKVLFPDMKINSGFRLKGNNVSKTSGVSEHETGYAADIGFTSFPPGIKNRQELFLERAITISDNIPEYDKLILESKSDGKNWIHISFKQNKNNKIKYTIIDDGNKFGGKNYEGLRLV